MLPAVSCLEMRAARSYSFPAAEAASCHGSTLAAEAPPAEWRQGWAETGEMGSSALQPAAPNASLGRTDGYPLPNGTGEQLPCPRHRLAALRLRGVDETRLHTGRGGGGGEAMCSHTHALHQN